MEKRKVLITGASSGIGRELAGCFAAHGDDLILTARRGDRLNELSEQLTQKYGVVCTPIVCDLSRPDAAQFLYEECRRRNLQVDVLVNNAGFGLNAAFVDSDLQKLVEMIQVNVTTLVELTHLFLPDMIDRKKGGILNVASTAAFQPGPFMAVYYASKAFVLSFTEALAEELRGTGVQVTCLAPGPVDTEFQQVSGLRSSAMLRLLGKVSAAETAEKAFRGFQRGKLLVIPGMMNKLGVFSVRILPRSLVRSMIRSINQVFS